MKHARMAPCTVAVVTVALLVAVAVWSTETVEAQSRGHGLTGTWYTELPTGLVLFSAFNQDGTTTSVASTIFGGAPRPGTLRSADHGLWRRIGNGYESVIYRMGFDMSTGDVATITRIRSIFALDSGRESRSGTFLVAVWVCPTPTTCPDPTVDPPNVPEFAPPGNTFTSTRVRMP